MESIFFATAALAVAATTAVWRAWRAEAAREAEARARQEAEERAQREAEAREAEARARQEAEERAQRAAADLARAQERAKKEVEARREAEERAKAEARARRDAERRAAKAGAEVAEARCDVARRVDEPTLVGALARAIPAMDPERGRRLQNQLEALARNRADAEKLRKDLETAAEEAARDQIKKKLQKAEFDAQALVERLRNIVEKDPALQGVRLSLAWGSRVSTSKDKKTESKK